MDPIPDSTHVAQVKATVDSIESGLDQIPLARAINRIDDWKREIEQTERADLTPIAEGLGRLHELLTGEGLSATAIGHQLIQLGEQTEGAEASDAVRPGLQRLGSLLRHAGNALAGSAAPATTSDAPPA